MKKHVFILILLGLIFSSQAGFCSSKAIKDPIIITGKVLGEIPDKIYYTLPINGVCNYAFKEAVKPDSLGSFTLKIIIEKPSFVNIFIPGKANATLLVESGMDYDVIFNLESKENTFKVICESQKGQDSYNALPKPGHIQAGAREFLKDSVASDIKVKIQSLKDDEISLFANLRSNGHISEDFFQLVKLDRECYYSAVLGTVALIKKYEGERLNDGSFSLEIKQMWDDSFANALPTNSVLINSPWYISLAENYILHNEYTHENFDFNKLKEIFDNGLRHTHSIEEAKKHLTSTMLEYYTASYIYTSCLQQKYEKEFISLFEDFKNNFPNSDYTKYLTPMVIPIVEFHKKKEEPYNENIHFISAYENINSIKESVSSFKGKKVYVDVWATWCGPCKKEFEHKTQLKKLIESNNMVVLYISIDRDEKENQWKEMIKYYNLEGYHIRASQKLNEDLIEIFSGNGSIAIPWYILIDEHGNIINKHASPPSQLKELEEEINN